MGNSHFFKKRVVIIALCLLIVCLFSWYAYRHNVDVYHPNYSSRRFSSKEREMCSCLLHSETYTSRPLTTASPESLCQTQVSQRGSHQRVVSYCLDGDVTNELIFDRYFRFINQVAQQVADIYPGWVMRIYHNYNSTDPAFKEYLCKTYCQHAHVDLCNITDLALKSPDPLAKDVADTFLMMWRFLPMADPTVDVFLSRDLDSPVTIREGATVSDWLYGSKATLQVLRDNLAHRKPIMGGMWGVRSDLGRRDELRQVFLEMKQESFSYPKSYGMDQDVLTRLHSAIGMADSVRYDSYYCTEFPNITRPYPTRREGFNFVGSRLYQETKRLTKCPIECRPFQHKEWEYC